MPDDAARERAARLREAMGRHGEETSSDTQQADESAPDAGPRPGESPNSYVERRMRETVKKKRP